MEGIYTYGIAPIFSGVNSDPYVANDVLCPSVMPLLDVTILCNNFVVSYKRFARVFASLPV